MIGPDPIVMYFLHRVETTLKSYIKMLGFAMLVICNPSKLCSLQVEQKKTVAKPAKKRKANKGSRRSHSGLYFRCVSDKP